MDRLCRARLIAIEECRKKKMRSPSDVVRAQRGKSPYVMSSTADILVRHGFVDDSNFLLGEQTGHLCLYLLCLHYPLHWAVLVVVVHMYTCKCLLDLTYAGWYLWACRCS